MWPFTRYADPRLLSQQNKLHRWGHLTFLPLSEYCSKYKEQMRDMVSREVAQKLTMREVESYEGPVFYLPHHEIHKPESQSTPLRIVLIQQHLSKGLH